MMKGPWFDPQLDPDLHLLNLNSLLVTCQMIIFHQGVRMGEKLVPRTQKRSELGHTII